MQNTFTPSELADLRRDAERYRWLRVQHWSDSPLAVVVNPKTAIKLGHDAPSHERLDAAIDAEVSEAQGFLHRPAQDLRSGPVALSAAQPARCPLCNYQHGHQIGCENNPVDIALKAKGIKDQP